MSQRLGITSVFNEKKADLSNMVTSKKYIDSAEHKANIGKANSGRKATEATKQKLSESHKGIKQSEESRKKRSETIKAWWAKRKSNEEIVNS